MSWKRAFPQNCIRETVVSKTGKAKTSEAKTRFSCITEVHESTGQRRESATKSIHEEHIAGKRQNSVLHCNWVHKSVPMPQAIKIPDAKAAVDKEWKSMRLLQHRMWEKSRAKKEFIKEAQKNNNKVHFASLMDLEYIWGSCCSSVNETETDTHSQDSCGRDSSKNHWWNLDRSMWMTSKRTERSRI